MKRSVKRRIRGRDYLKERIIMAVCAVTVLGTLTAAGIWMRKDTGTKDQGYVVDLSEMESSEAADISEKNETGLAKNIAEEAQSLDDLDYDPYFQETNSVNVENPDQSESESMSDGAEDGKANVSGKKDSEAETDTKEDEAEQPPETEDGKPAISTAMQPTLSFGENDSLVWPVVGNILVNYSMDKTIYFPTLDQYKYNPAIIIQANEGDIITAAAAGKVISVFENPQIGKGVTMDLGNGYEVTYGQLEEILVSEGSYVSMGDMIAQVAAPTRYYSTEGTNVYFKLTKDGEPINPMTRLN